MTNFLEIEILNKIKSVIKPIYLESADIYIQENIEKSSKYNSLMIKGKPTIYRNNNASILFARLKTTKKIQYISFSLSNQKYINGLFNFTKISSEDFLRIDINEFLSLIDNPNVIEAINQIFINSFNFTSFGCCARYKQCSAEKMCIHPDQIYATACDYRKNLEQGKIFY